MKTEDRRPLALILYLLSLLIMLAVTAIMLWPEIELLLFDRPLITEERLETLRCPLAITPEEKATVTATFTNNLSRSERFRAQARLSYHSAVVIDEVNHWIELAPGETDVVSWSLDPESAAFGRIILARVHVSRRGGTPPQQQGCGVMVLNLPYFSGAQYVAALAVAGLLTLAASGFVWTAGRRPAQVWKEPTTRRPALLAAIVAGAMFAGLFNLWALSSLLLVFSLLLLVSFGQR